MFLLDSKALEKNLSCDSRICQVPQVLLDRRAVTRLPSQRALWLCVVRLLYSAWSLPYRP